MSLYLDLRGAADRLAAELSLFYAGHLVCRAGCSDCCAHDLSVFEVEADQVRRALSRMPDEIMDEIIRAARAARSAALGGKEAPCPLLVHDLCAIYGDRPIICRTQGLPLLYETATGELEVDCCPLNFSRASAAADLMKDRLVPLDALNERLVRANLAFCRRAGISRAKSGRRLPMSRIILGL